MKNATLNIHSAWFDNSEWKIDLVIAINEVNITFIRLTADEKLVLKEDSYLENVKSLINKNRVRILTGMYKPNEYDLRERRHAIEVECFFENEWRGIDDYHEIIRSRNSG